MNKKVHSRVAVVMNLNFNKSNKIGSVWMKSFLQGRPTRPSSGRRLVTKESIPQPRGSQPSGFPRVEWAKAEGTQRAEDEHHRWSQDRAAGNANSCSSDLLSSRSRPQATAGLRGSPRSSVWVHDWISSVKLCCVSAALLFTVAWTWMQLNWICICSCFSTTSRTWWRLPDCNALVTVGFSFHSVLWRLF